MGCNARRSISTDCPFLILAPSLPVSIFLFPVFPITCALRKMQIFSQPLFFLPLPHSFSKTTGVAPCPAEALAKAGQNHSLLPRSKMTTETSNSCITSILSRCEHRSSSGRQCRGFATDSDSRLCQRHALSLQRQQNAVDITVFTGRLGSFESTGEVHDFLAKLLALVAENRVAPRRAAVLAYISHLLLRTLAAMQAEQRADEERNPPRLNFEGVFDPHPHPENAQPAPRHS
jgi:hypothetical protein